MMENRISFEYDGKRYVNNMNGYYFEEIEGKKKRISKTKFEEVYEAMKAESFVDGEPVDEITEDEKTEIAKLIEDDSTKPAIMDNYGGVDCSKCNVEGCVHRNCMRRNPTVKGGLGLCPRLNLGLDFPEKISKKADKPKAEKKVSKPKQKKVEVGGMEFDHDGAKITLTAKQVDFMKHLPDTCFWENGVDSEIWTDCLCDDIGGQFAAKPMTVGAMISTLCEKGLGIRTKQKRDNRKCTSFHLTDLGQKIAIELGL